MPYRPMPLPAKIAAPQPPNTSQNVPMSSATSFLVMGSRIRRGGYAGLGGVRNFGCGLDRVQRHVGQTTMAGVVAVVARLAVIGVVEAGLFGFDARAQTDERLDRIRDDDGGADRERERDAHRL